MLAKTPESQPTQPPSETIAEAKPKPEKAAELQVQPHSEQAAESDSNGLVIHGSVNNAATSSTRFRRLSAIGGRAAGVCTRELSARLSATRSSMRDRIH